MNFRTILPMVMAVFFVSQTIGDTYMMKFITESHHENFTTGEDYYYLTCYNNGRFKDAKLQKNSMDKIFKSIQNKTICEIDESFFCIWLRNSQYCVGNMKTCTPVSGSGSGYICTKNFFATQASQITNSVSNEIFQALKAHNSKASGVFEKIQIISIDSKPSNETFEMWVSDGINSGNGPSGVLRRKPRQSVACFYPSMQTSSLSFTKYPSSIRAKQKCIFGYTLKEGISREMRCVYAENKWKPTGFEECRPFIDCSIELTSTGHMECFTATTGKAPTCNITCDRYEDKAGVPKGSYECQIYGGWKPRLPFCATPGTGLDVAPAPRIRVHPIESEPEPKPPKKLPKMVKPIHKLKT